MDGPIYYFFVSRGLVVFFPSYAPPVLPSLLAALESDAMELQLLARADLLPKNAPQDRLIAYDQRNVAVSRKKLQPALEAALIRALP
jgi:hypothetical protein